MDEIHSLKINRLQRILRQDNSVKLIHKQNITRKKKGTTHPPLFSEENLKTSHFSHIIGSYPTIHMAPEWSDPWQTTLAEQLLEDCPVKHLVLGMIL